MSIGHSSNQNRAGKDINADLLAEFSRPNAENIVILNNALKLVMEIYAKQGSERYRGVPSIPQIMDDCGSRAALERLTDTIHELTGRLGKKPHFTSQSEAWDVYRRLLACV